MFDLLGRLRGSSRRRRRVAFAVLFGLQGAIALSPLVEPGISRRGGAHVEQQGDRSHYEHDEATCAVCAVGSIHSSPVPVCLSVAVPNVCASTAGEVLLETGRRPDGTSHARAPPRLG